MRAKRTNPEIRKAQILDAAIRLAIKVGYNALTQQAVAREADVSSSLIPFYFPTIATLKEAVLERAIEQKMIPVLAQIVTLNPGAIKGIDPQTARKIRAYVSLLT